MTLYVILTLVFGILTIVTVTLREGYDKKGMSAATMVCAVLLGAFFVIMLVKSEPTALDVYRGKTTLEITYRDSVAIDSTVVYKVK
jgi:uncharacterized membrane protein (UPF0136 family)